MNDDYVVSYLRNRYKCIPFRFLHSTQPEIYKYLINRFDDCNSLRETFYRLEHKMYNPICPICGDKLKFDGEKYPKTCSKRKCINKWKGIKNKQVFIEKFGCENPFQNEQIKEKIKHTNLQKYGVDNIFKSTKFKIFYKEHKNDILDKGFETKRKNGTFNKSKPEDQSYIILKEKFPDVIRQYKDKERYPFNCDFYIPCLDLFIECNYHWTHGSHPYDGNNISDINQATKWKFSDSKYKNIAYNTCLLITLGLYVI